MWQLLQFLALLMFVAMCYQLYRFSLLYHTGLEKQRSCRNLGISFTTIGIVSLAFHSFFFVFAGFILIMFGLRLIAHGLDRLEKKIFIDRYQDEE